MCKVLQFVVLNKMDYVRQVKLAALTLRDHNDEDFEHFRAHFSSRVDQVRSHISCPR